MIQTRSAELTSIFQSTIIRYKKVQRQIIPAHNEVLCFILERSNLLKTELRLEKMPSLIVDYREKTESFKKDKSKKILSAEKFGLSVHCNII